MIPAFVNIFDANRKALREGFALNPPEGYSDLVLRVVKMLNESIEARNTASNGALFDALPDPERITTIDHGHYQGTQVFVVACTGYQPSTYWYICVSYGSCGSCDSFQRAMDESSEYDGNGNKVLSESTLDQLMLLTLHIVQAMKQMDADCSP